MKKIEASKIVKYGYDTYIDVPVHNLNLRKDDIIVLSNFGIENYKEFVVNDITAIENAQATILLVENKKVECDNCQGTGFVSYIDEGYLEEDNCQKCEATGYVSSN